MVSRTYAEYKGKIYKWNELLDKLNLGNDGYSSGRIQFYKQASSKQLENLRCLIKDEDGEYVEICNLCEELIDDCECGNDEEETCEECGELVDDCGCEKSENINVKLKNDNEFILKPEIFKKLQPLKIIDDNTNYDTYKWLVLDKKDIYGLNNKNTEVYVKKINDMFYDLNMCFYAAAAGEKSFIIIGKYDHIIAESSDKKSQKLRNEILEKEKIT